MRSILIVLVLTTAGCHRQPPDLTPIREALEQEEATVCAQPASRPPHAARTRDVSREEAQAALTTLSKEDDPGAIETVHAALTGERPTVGELRRFDLVLRSAPVDLNELTRDKNGLVKARAIVEAGASASPGLHVSRIERAFLSAAQTASAGGRVAEALERCADVVALERDRFLVGSLTDMMLGAAMLDSGKRACIPIIDAAQPAERAAFATSLATLRTSMPAFGDALRRDRAEMLLYQFGAAFGSGHPFVCNRAREFAEAMGHSGASPDARELTDAWRRPEVADASPSNAAKYASEYESKLRDVDEMLDHARR
jgi:hypothetical protein